MQFFDIVQSWTVFLVVLVPIWTELNLENNESSDGFDWILEFDYIKSFFRFKFISTKANHNLSTYLSLSSAALQTQVKVNKGKGKI